MMSKFSKAIVIIVALAFFGLALLWQNSKKSYQPKTSDLQNKADTKAQKLIYFDPKYFWAGVDYANKNSSPAPKNIAGGIIPHHLLPGFILADFFKKLQGQNPKTIILIGPNHKELGLYKVLSSEKAWQTNFGNVEPNLEIIQKLKQEGLVNINESVVEDEHSVAGMMSFIKFYLPKVQVVPLVIRASLNQQECQTLANRLGELKNNDTIIVAPVDFSHYLTAPQAEANDKVSLKTMMDFNYGKLFKMNNDFVDSPPSIALELMIMQKLGATHFNVLFDTNSGILEKNDFIKTTSYFSIMFN